MVGTLAVCFLTLPGVPLAARDLSSRVLPQPGVPGADLDQFRKYNFLAEDPTLHTYTDNHDGQSVERELKF